MPVGRVLVWDPCIELALVDCDEDLAAGRDSIGRERDARIHDLQVQEKIEN